MSITKTAKPAPQIGQVYQEIRNDEHGMPSKRRIKITELLPNGFRVKVLCNSVGKATSHSTLMDSKTINAGYRLCES